MLGAVDRSYTTSGLRAERQFDAWRGIVADAFVPVEVDSGAADAGRGFTADCHVRTVGDLAVSWMRSASQQVRRTEAHTARTPSGLYFLNLPLDLGSTIHQDGRIAQLRPGDFAIIDADRPFRLEFDGDFTQISLAIPKTALQDAMVGADAVTAVTIPGDDGVGALAASTFTGLASYVGAIDGRVVDAVAMHVIGLLAAALDARAPAPVARRAMLYGEILNEIERHYHEPDLTLTDVARSISISPSYATKLLAENGTSFGRRLMARRLDHAWTLLVRERRSSITDIAILCGFNDPAHFARAFRARFGMAPSDRRRVPDDHGRSLR